MLVRYEASYFVLRSMNNYVIYWQRTLAMYNVTLKYQVSLLRGSQHW